MGGGWQGAGRADGQRAGVLPQQERAVKGRTQKPCGYPHGTVRFAPLGGGVAQPPGLGVSGGFGQVTSFLWPVFPICEKMEKGWASFL